MHEILNMFFALIFICCVIYAIIWDVTRRRVPNLVPIILVAAFFPYALFVGQLSIGPHILLASVIFILFFGFWMIHWVGAADVKFLAAIMLWAGPAQGTRLTLIMALLSAALALVLLGLRRVVIYYPIVAEWPGLKLLSRWAKPGAAFAYILPMGLAALSVAPAIFVLR